MFRKFLAAVTTLALAAFGLTVSTPASAANSIPVTFNITGLPEGCSFNGGFVSGSSQDVYLSEEEGLGSKNISMSCGTGSTAKTTFTFNFFDPNLTSVDFEIPSSTLQDFTGQADVSFSECLSAATYHLYADGNQYVDENGAFTVDQSIDVSIKPDAETGTYSFTAPISTQFTLGATDNLDDSKTGQCSISAYGGVTFSGTDTTFDLRDNNAKLNIALDVPASKADKCKIQFGDGFFDAVSKYDTVDNLSAASETVVCEGISRTLPVQFDSLTTVTRGLSYDGVIYVPDYELISVSGKVNTNYTACLTNLTMGGWSPDGYQIDSSAFTINEDGTYSVSLPKGTWYLGAQGGSDPLVSGGVDPCSSEAKAFVGGAETQTIDFPALGEIIKVNLTQPAGYDDCAVGDLSDPNHDLVGVRVGDTTASVSVTCGDYRRAVRFNVPAEVVTTSPPTEVTVQVPALSIRRISGSFSVPSTINSENARNSVSVSIGTIWDDMSGSTQGWSRADFSPMNAQLNWSNKTYTADVPTGSYTLNIATSLPDSTLNKGCYPVSYYAGAGKPATWSSQLASAVAVSAGTGTQSVPSLGLKIGANIRVTWSYPEGVRADSIGFNLFNAAKQRDNEPRGNSSMSSDPYYNFYCVAPGTYYVNAKGSTIGTQFFGGTNTIDKAKAVTVRTDGTADAVNFTLYPLSVGSISGTIVDVAGLPQTSMSDYTVWAAGSNGSIGSAPVDSSGHFNLVGLETNNVYRLVVAQDSQFGNTGISAGGKNFAFYGNVHERASASLIALSTIQSAVSDLQFMYTPSDTDASLADVQPVAQISQPNPPVDTLAAVQSQIEAGTIKLDGSTITGTTTDGIVNLNATVNFDGLKDTSVDMYLISSTDIAAGPSSLRLRAASAAATTAWLGRVSIIDNKVKLPTSITANAGLNQIVLVGRTSESKVAYPLVVGRAKPSLVKKFALTGSARKGKTLYASGGKWVGSPTSISLSYKWYRCSKPSSSCKTISGAKKSSYKLTSSDVRKYIKVTITAKNSVGSSSVSLTSGKAR